MVLLLEKGIFWENWLIVLLSTCCSALCYSVSNKTKKKKKIHRLQRHCTFYQNWTEITHLCSVSMFQLNKSFILSFRAAVITVVNFNVLTLSLINVQCLQNDFFSLEKGSNSPNNSLSNAHNQLKNFFHSKNFNCSHLVGFPTTLEYYLANT